MKVAVIGTGGVGGYFGARLAQAGNDVTFVARGVHFETIKKDGLKLNSIKGDFHLFPANVVNSIEELPKCNLILVAVKAWQVKEVAADLVDIVDDNTSVLPLQNGVLAAKELLEFLPQKNILSGLCRIFSKIESPGVIQHMSAEPTIIFGEMDNSKTARTEMLINLFSSAEINFINPSDIEKELWKKYILICLSGLCAVARCAHGPLREIPETREMMIGLLNEVYQVGLASGVALELNTVEKIIANVDAMNYDATSSLTRDIWDGKPSEIEYQNGTVVKIGARLGLPTPINKFVYTCLLPSEKIARGLNF